MHTVFDVNNDIKYIFKADNPYDAMQKMLYTLNFKGRDNNAVIKETDSGYFLIHRNFEYWIKK